MTKIMARKLDVSGKTAKLHVKRKIVPSKRGRKNLTEEPPTIVEDMKGTKLKIEKSIGDRIREAREAQGITQDTLAKNLTRILQHEGVVDRERGRSSIAQWETGRAFPEFITIPAIAKAVNKSPEFIAFGVTDEPVKVMPDPE
jgi:ribosome-binding protein aMBF1 (putative translation factor)